jgi:hypothetical protein
MSPQYARKDLDNKMGYIRRLTPQQRAAQLVGCLSLFPDAESVRDAYVDASHPDHEVAKYAINAWQGHFPVVLVETIDVNPTKGGVI